MVQAMISEHNDSQDDLTEIETNWYNLERAFLNNSPEVHSYLNLRSGDVLRLVDGAADADVHEQIRADDGYLELDSVGSRTQFEWMTDFADEVEDVEVSEDLLVALEGGKGVFGRFKQTLSTLPAVDQQWQRFRGAKTRTVIERFLAGQGLVATERRAPVRPVLPAVPHERATATADRRKVLTERVSDINACLSLQKLESVRAFAEFVANQN